MSQYLNVIDSFHGEYRFLSNFYPAPVVYEQVRYATVEHAYQAQKTLNSKERLEIARCMSPSKAKRKGCRVKLRADWESNKVRIMTELVQLKFDCHADLQEKLLATGTCRLIEGNTWNDQFWGVCQGVGKNWLGKILMKVRSELARSVPQQNS